MIAGRCEIYTASGYRCCWIAAPWNPTYAYNGR